MTGLRFLFSFSGVMLVTCMSALAQRQVATPQAGINRTTGGDPATGTYASPARKDADAADPEEQKIWNAARQLGLDSDQRAQLSTSLKEQRVEGASLEKALQDARTALARALQDGQTSLESEIEDLASANAKVQESQLKRWAALFAVLAPDQQRRLLMMPTPLSQAATSSGPTEARTQAQ